MMFRFWIRKLSTSDLTIFKAFKVDVVKNVVDKRKKKKQLQQEQQQIINI